MLKKILFTLPVSVVISLIVLGVTSTSAIAAKPDKPNNTQVRSYYLSQNLAKGFEVFDACADGYHFASVWEIWHFSALAYNSELGRTSVDSLYGPTSDWTGWVAWGKTADTYYNCEAWYSGDSQHTGGTISLNLFKVSGQLPNEDVWKVDHRPCDMPNAVWCVSDFVQ